MARIRLKLCVVADSYSQTKQKLFSFVCFWENFQRNFRTKIVGMTKSIISSKNNK